VGGPKGLKTAAGRPPAGLEGSGRAGPGDTLGSPWPLLAIHFSVPFQENVIKKLVWSVKIQSEVFLHLFWLFPDLTKFRNIFPIKN
jgi:hypothetical protein